MYLELYRFASPLRKFDTLVTSQWQRTLCNVFDYLLTLAASSIYLETHPKATHSIPPVPGNRHSIWHFMVDEQWYHFFLALPGTPWYTIYEKTLTSLVPNIETSKLAFANFSTVTSAKDTRLEAIIETLRNWRLLAKLLNCSHTVGQTTVYV